MSSINSLRRIEHLQIDFNSGKSLPVKKISRENSTTKRNKIEFRGKSKLSITNNIHYEILILIKDSFSYHH